MKRTAVFIFIAAAAARLILAFMTPLSDQPAVIPHFNDEEAHYNYIRYLDRYNRLPVQTASVQEEYERKEYEYYQPPLYYCLARPFYTLGKKTSPNSPIFWVRLATIILGLGALGVLYRTARQIFDSRPVALAVLLTAGFVGVTLRFGSVVTNDSLLFLLAALYAALIFQIIERGCDRRLYWAGIIIAITGLWTKASFLIIVPLLPLALYLEEKRSVLKVAGSIVLPLAAITPWYLRNLMLYGRMIPLEVGFGAGDPVSGANLIERVYWTGNYFVRSFFFPFDQLWSGGLDVVIYPLAGVLLLLFFCTGCKAIFKENRKSGLFAMLFIGLNLLSYVGFNLIYFQAEARLLMPSIPVLLLLTGRGAMYLFKERSTLAILVLTGWILLPWAGLFA